MTDDDHVKTQRHREDNVTTEAETGVTPIKPGNPEDYQPSPEVRTEAWDRFSLRALRRKQP